MTHSAGLWRTQAVRANVARRNVVIMKTKDGSPAMAASSASSTLHAQVGPRRTRGQHHCKKQAKGQAVHTKSTEPMFIKIVVLSLGFRRVCIEYQILS